MTVNNLKKYLISLCRNGLRMHSEAVFIKGGHKKNLTETQAANNQRLTEYSVPRKWKVWVNRLKMRIL